MIKTLHQVSSYLLIALGTVHTLLTPVLMSRLSQGALYFAGAGLAMIMLGFLNIALRRNADPVVRSLALIANILFVIFSVLATFVVREPQAYFALLLLLTLTITAFMLKRARDAQDR